MASSYPTYGYAGNFALGTPRYAAPASAAQASAAPASAAPVASAGSGKNYTALAQSADAERILQAQRAIERQNLAIGGYGTQIAESRARGEYGYQELANNYAAAAADSNDTRSRNMARVEQYGDSMRDDLNIKHQRALAAASQSAIKRGLGNTTIQDSMVRGQNFDNTRQLMSLEDQLLQNRISTDASLSKNYQDILQAKAQGLANMWNQNTQTDNQLATARLGYIGGINENMDAFNSVANLYSQGLQMNNANQQAERDRQERERSARYASNAQQRLEGARWMRNWADSHNSYGGGNLLR